MCGNNNNNIYTIIDKVKKDNKNIEIFKAYCEIRLNGHTNLKKIIKGRIRKLLNECI